MYLIQLFLPVYDETGSVFPEAHFVAVRKQLTDKFGGRVLSRPGTWVLGREKERCTRMILLCSKSWQRIDSLAITWSAARHRCSLPRLRSAHVPSQVFYLVRTSVSGIGWNDFWETHLARGKR
jgi:hypothetical protein